MLHDADASDLGVVVARKGRTVLTCRAPHPLASAGHGRFAGRTHGIRLQILPLEARPTYRTVSDWSEVADGCVAVRCPQCGAFTEYRLVPPAPGGAPGAGSSKGRDDTGRDLPSREGPNSGTRPGGPPGMRAESPHSPHPTRSFSHEA